MANDSLTLEEPLPLPLTFTIPLPSDIGIAFTHELTTLPASSWPVVPRKASYYLPKDVKYSHPFSDYRSVRVPVLELTGFHNKYPSMGFSNSVSVGHSWEVTDGITLYGGVYASDNMYHTTRFKDFGVSGRIRVQVADGVFLNGYGNYSVYDSGVPGQRPPFMYPTDSYGGSVEVKITDKFGLQAGVQRGFSLFTRQWETSYYVLPVFY